MTFNELDTPPLLPVWSKEEQELYSDDDQFSPRCTRVIDRKNITTSHMKGMTKVEPDITGVEKSC